jgi:hypothetical protein
MPQKTLSGLYTGLGPRPVRRTKVLVGAGYGSHILTPGGSGAQRLKLGHSGTRLVLPLPEGSQLLWPIFQTVMAICGSSAVPPTCVGSVGCVHRECLW